MKIVALLAFRNEASRLRNCLRHLIAEGLEVCLIDNESTDRGRQVVEDFLHKGVIRIERVSYPGFMDLPALLQTKMNLAREIDADWFLHVDADEIMHSYRDGETLRAGIGRLDAEGWDVINFDEFVFLPVDVDYVPDCASVQPLRHYYFFEPYKQRLMRAWRGSRRLSNLDMGGHILTGGDFRLAPETFALRHYIFRDQAHAFEKYATLHFNPIALARGWHANRVGQPAERFRFPERSALECLTAATSRDLCRERPHLTHYWQW